jgi:MATE family multidrug resistance protein
MTAVSLKSSVPSGDAAGASLFSDITRILKFAAPIALGQLLIMGMHVTDTMVLGRLGADALAAAALTGSLLFFVFIFGMGVVTAIAPLISEAHGRGEPEEVGRLQRQGLLLAGGLGVLLALVLQPAPVYLRWLGQEERLAADTALYLSSLRWSLPPILILIAYRNYLASTGRPMLGTFFIGLDFLLNIPVAAGLVHGLFGLPKLGLYGAGLATTLVASFSALCVMIMAQVAPGLRDHWRLGGSWLPDLVRLKRLIMLGVPIGVTLVMEVGLFAISTLMMGWVGELPLAGHQVALQIASITFMVPMGIAQASTVLIGQAMGAGNAALARRTGWVAVGASLIFMIFMALLFLLLREPLVGLFLSKTDPRTPEVLAWGALFLIFAGLFQVADGLQVVGGGVLRGLQDARWPMIFAAFGYWGCGLTSAYAFAFILNWGGSGIWLGQVVGLFVVAVLMVGRYHALTRNFR